MLVDEADDARLSVRTRVGPDRHGTLAGPEFDQRHLRHCRLLVHLQRRFDRRHRSAHRGKRQREFQQRRQRRQRPGRDQFVLRAVFRQMGQDFGTVFDGSRLLEAE